MSDRAMELMGQNVPWRRGVAWPIVLIEGLVFLAVGIYVLVAPDNARTVVRQLMGAILLVNGILQVVAGFRARAALESPFRILRGGIGATIGAIVTLEPLSDYLEPAASRVVLAIGFLAAGLVGLAGAVAMRAERGLRTGELIVNGLYVALAILLLSGSPEDSGRLTTLGIAAIVIGLLLLAYAYYLNRARQDATPAASAAEAPPA